MKKIFDTANQEITEGNTILIFNEDSKKWSLELVILESGELYSSFEKLHSSILTKLKDVPKENIVRLFNKGNRDFFYNDSIKIKELYPIDYNKIHSMMQDARGAYTGNNCWDMTEEDYLKYFESYKGKFNPDVLEFAIQETVKRRKF